MKPLGGTRQHFWLAKRMAGQHALDLAQAMARGDLDQSDWAKVVQRCRECDWTGGCRRYLARGEGAKQAAEKWPGGCPNRAVFATLKAMEELENTYERQ
ncbi:DUF6455 family protein [Marimonas arenosa]|uniref:DUF6455 family protein n=1 Tax=Marimonas arenosa TaxID=1795305 RepID=A0AAE3WBY4_9RHOB|nr:DUF6455 family protein [Marimonas arenosa]MDQ2090131.1 DUF6455 family protein [Marimonas arenosa]